MLPEDKKLRVLAEHTIIEGKVLVPFIAAHGSLLLTLEASHRTTLFRALTLEQQKMLHKVIELKQAITKTNDSGNAWLNVEQDVTVQRQQLTAYEAYAANWYNEAEISLGDVPPLL